MKLLYIASLDFYTKPNPSYHLMTSMLEDVLSHGIAVEFIGCAEKGLEKHIPDDLAANELFHFTLVPTKSIGKSKFVKRYVEGVKYSKRISNIIKKKAADCDLIFVQSSPTVMYTLLYAKKYAKSTKIIYNIQDMFPGSSIASGVMKQKWMQKIFYSMQKQAYHKADIITVISEDMKQKVKDQGVTVEKIHVIYNWFDDHSIHEVPWSENRFVKKYNMSPDKFYIQYAGTMGYVFDYHIVLKVAQKLLPYNNIEFQMIGAGSQKQDFISEAQKLGLNNIKFYPLEPQHMVSDVYSACTVCFIPLKNGVIGNSVPSKAGLLMACKRAIVTSADRDSIYCKMINDNQIGIGVGASDSDSAANALLKLYNNRELCNFYGHRGYEYGHELYSRKHNMDKYFELFKIVAGEKR